MRRARLGLLLALAPLAALAPSPAAACTVSASGVAFGDYSFSDPGPTDGVGTINLGCHPSASPVISIDAGGSGSFAPRRMQNGVHRLNYNLFTNVARTIVWGNGSGGSSTFRPPSGTVTGGVRHFTVPVYGRIPAGQNAAAGTYSDTLIITVTF
ncbi:MAG: spore coat U domain-containing protein [Allosphingosinicella sp.]|uniref:Csu type fimbrial protein n=1 Tax=Allosphingosinicella sp. TaxID=2823234 RepID=UPI00395943F9